MIHNPNAVNDPKRKLTVSDVSTTPPLPDEAQWLQAQSFTHEQVQEVLRWKKACDAALLAHIRAGLPPESFSIASANNQPYVSDRDDGWNAYRAKVTKLLGEVEQGASAVSEETKQ